VGIARSTRTVRIVVALWLLLAVVVWHVVFDREVVAAGREFVKAAAAAGPGLRIDDWMRPAVARGVWRAHAAAGVVLAAGLIVRAVARRLASAPRRGPEGL
jgi:hypothetical protein